MFVISTYAWTFFCSSVSNLKSPTLLCKRNNVKSVKSHSKFQNINSKQSLALWLVSHSNLDIFFSLVQQEWWLLKMIFERENSNNKAECNEMFDLYVDGTKIEISRFFSDWNVPLLKVSKFRKQIMVSKLLLKNKPNSLSWKVTTSR